MFSHPPCSDDGAFNKGQFSEATVHGLSRAGSRRFCQWLLNWAGAGGGADRVRAVSGLLPCPASGHWCSAAGTYLSLSPRQTYLRNLNEQGGCRKSYASGGNSTYVLFTLDI